MRSWYAIRARAEGAEVSIYDEIGAYGTARTLAQQLGQDEVAELLQETLHEESAADEKLTEIAESEIYPQVQEEAAEEGDAAYAAPAPRRRPAAEVANPPSHRSARLVERKMRIPAGWP